VESRDYVRCLFIQTINSALDTLFNEQSDNIGNDENSNRIDPKHLYGQFDVTCEAIETAELFKCGY